MREDCVHHNAEKIAHAAGVTRLSAAAIYQSWLDELASAVWDRRYEFVADAMIYPSKMITEDAELEFTEPEPMIEAARAFRENLSQMRADAYHRICVRAWFIGDAATRINGEHVTYIMSGGRYVVEPFANEMTLVWDNARWLGGGIRSLVRNSRLMILSPEQLLEQYKK